MRTVHCGKEIDQRQKTQCCGEQCIAPATEQPIAGRRGARRGHNRHGRPHALLAPVAAGAAREFLATGNSQPSQKDESRGNRQQPREIARPTCLGSRLASLLERGWGKDRQAMLYARRSNAPGTGVILGSAAASDRGQKKRLGPPRKGISSAPAAGSSPRPRNQIFAHAAAPPTERKAICPPTPP